MRGRMSAGACSSIALSVVVTPLTLLKSLSVKTATRISCRQFWHARERRRRASHQIEQEILVEAFFHHEVQVCPCKRDGHERQPKNPPEELCVSFCTKRIAADAGALIEA